MRLANLAEKIPAFMAAMFRPIPEGTIEDWASGKTDPDKEGRPQPNIELDSKESGDFAGGYDPDLNPLPTILFEVYRSGKYKKAVFKKSSQSGVTLACLILICWFVSFVTRNFLYVIDSLEEMRRVSQERLQPMLKKCRAALDQIPTSEDDMKTLTLSLRGCVGYLVGAGSLGALSNKSVGLAIFDEVDAHPEPPKEQERATELGAERGKKQSNFFEVWLSKPIDWDGPITQEYLIGTRHKCFVPCPHCGTYQEIVWSGMQYEHCKDEKGNWDYERILHETYYLCNNEECQNGPEGGKIFEHHKPEMIRRREWRQTNFNQDEFKLEPEIFSCEITDFLSTFPTATWGILAKEFVQSEGNDSKRQKFWRGRAAQGKKKKKIKTDKDDIKNLCGEYLRGQCPVEPDQVVIFCDVQGIEGPDKKVETGVRKWVKAGLTFEDDGIYVIDWGELFSYNDLLVEADVPVKILKWNDDTPKAERVDPVVYKGLIDEGFQQKEVRTWCVSTLLPTRLADGSPDYRFYSSWGQGGMHSRHMRDLVTPRHDEPPNVTHEGYPFYAYRYSDDNFKDSLYNKRIGLAREHLRAELEGREGPKETPRPLAFPADVTDAFISELCQESYEKIKKTGKWGWKEPRKANDYGDGVKGCDVISYILKPAWLLAKAKERKAKEAAAS